MKTIKMEMTKEAKELLLRQAIKSEEQIINHLETFLETFPLYTSVNKCVALELMNVIVSKEQVVEELKKTVVN
jgi:hypothetical protein